MVPDRLFYFSQKDINLIYYLYVVQYPFLHGYRVTPAFFPQETPAFTCKNHTFCYGCPFQSTIFPISSWEKTSVSEPQDAMSDYISENPELLSHQTSQAAGARSLQGGRGKFANDGNGDLSGWIAMKEIKI